MSASRPARPASPWTFVLCIFCSQVPLFELWFNPFCVIDEYMVRFGHPATGYTNPNSGRLTRLKQKKGKFFSDGKFFNHIVLLPMLTFCAAWGTEKAPEMKTSECWQQAQVAEIAVLQAEFDDARMRPRGGAEALERTCQLSDTLEAVRNELLTHCPEAVIPGCRPPVAAVWCDARVCTVVPAYVAQMAPAGESWDRFFGGRVSDANKVVAAGMEREKAPTAAAAGVGWDRYFGGRVSDEIAADLSSLCQRKASAIQGVDVAEAEHPKRAPIDYASSPETPLPDADAAALMRAAEKKKVMRAATKELYTKLDALLPPTRSAYDFDAEMLDGQAVKSRMVGRTGRSLIEILHDAVHCVKMHHSTAPSWKPQKGRRGSGQRGKKHAGATAYRKPDLLESSALPPVHPCESRTRITAPHLEPGILQMSMLSSQSILCIGKP